MTTPPASFTTGHTPTPWKWQHGKYGMALIYGGDAKASYVAEIGGHSGLQVADADFIVLACNAHDALYAALLECEQSIVPGTVIARDTGVELLKLIRAALALASRERGA